MLGVDGASEKEYPVKRSKHMIILQGAGSKAMSITYIIQCMRITHVSRLPIYYNQKQAREKHTSISSVTHSYSVGQVQRMEMSSSVQ